MLQLGECIRRHLYGSNVSNECHARTCPLVGQWVGPWCSLEHDNYARTLQKQKGCFNQLGLSQLHLHYQGVCIQADQLTNIQVLIPDSTLKIKLDHLYTSSV